MSSTKEKGKYKLGVFFINHQQPNGNAYYFHSRPSQDISGRVVLRFKKLVLEKWAGKVSWAGIYEDGVLIQKFDVNNGYWERA